MKSVEVAKFGVFNDASDVGDTRPAGPLNGDYEFVDFGERMFDWASDCAFFRSKPVFVSSIRNMKCWKVW